MIWVGRPSDDESARCCAVTVTNGIRIEATSHYVQSHSNPASNTYRFTYRVTITNQSKNGRTDLCELCMQ